MTFAGIYNAIGGDGRDTLVDAGVLASGSTGLDFITLPATRAAEAAGDVGHRFTSISRVAGESVHAWQKLTY